MHPHVTFPDGKTIPVNPGPFYSGHMPLDPRTSVVVPLWLPVGPAVPGQRVQTADEIQALLDGEHGVITFTSPERDPAYWVASPDDARTLFAQVQSYPADWLPWATTGVALTVNGQLAGAYVAHDAIVRRLIRAS